VEPLTVPAADVLERARRLGPLPYSARGPSPAPTPPPDDELAAWLVDAVDTGWVDMGRPDPFILVEIGAGAGTRAAAFLGLGPQCLTALRYVLVEDDLAAAARQRIRLPIESPILVLGPVGDDDEADGDGDGPAPVEGIGPLVTSLTDLPVIDGPAAVVAIGWVSRLPSDRVEWGDGSWWEVRVAAGSAFSLEELLVPLDDDRRAAIEDLTGRQPRQPAGRYAQLGPAVDWLSGALRIAPSGWLAVIDRWTPMTRPLASGEAPPLALDQLASVRRPMEPGPVEIFSGWSLVSWRLG
jgi:hypothetical protein